MRITLAYISVVLLWATTPLAIKWSGEGPGFLFAATSRMAIGAACILFALAVLRKSLAWHRKAKMTYLAVALQIYGSMIAVYWASQFIPSGWISVIFGLAPLITALMANLLLKEHHLSFSKCCAYSLGVSGLYIMFGSALHSGESAVLGIAGVLVSTFLQSVSAVWIKRINAGLPALAQVAGGLGLALPAYLITWAMVDGQWPDNLSTVNLAAIIYLGTVATTVGFPLYYYLLTHLSATRVALISLMTPVMALMLGHLVNHEPLTEQTLTGTSLILAALVMHEMFDRLTFSNLKWMSGNKR
ncbi:DMT family transporter [Methyloglobulus sp.]|uniref:DMT family transporter n=1 Tax=Methyloglobulus sp. TaxID=2518622 RepID=UPI003989B7CD